MPGSQEAQIHIFDTNTVISAKSLSFSLSVRHVPHTEWPYRPFSPQGQVVILGMTVENAVESWKGSSLLAEPPGSVTLSTSSPSLSLYFSICKIDINTHLACLTGSLWVLP